MPVISSKPIVFNVPQKIGAPSGNGLNVSEIISSIQSAANLELLALAEQKLLSSVFNTGIVSIVNERGIVSPDALPDGNGGFIPTAFWGGYMSSSLRGMPVMCRLKFVGGIYTANDGTNITIPDIIFETVVIKLKQNKNIKKTNITGRRNQGSVKETSGRGDWEIDIRAVITASAPLNSNILSVNQDGVYPMDNMQALSVLLDSDVSIKVECWYLNKIANINWVVIDSGVDISQVEGEYEMQRVTIPCLSDNPLIITIQQTP